MKSDKPLIGTREVCRRVSDVSGYRVGDVRRCLDAFAQVLREGLASGNRVLYSGIGAFHPVARKAKGKEKRYRTVRYRPSLAVYRSLNDREEGEDGVFGRMG